ncbi:hypothetical protein As57867_003339, partial [Aphanomyces stellatus]
MADESEDASNAKTSPSSTVNRRLGFSQHNLDDADASQGSRQSRENAHGLVLETDDEILPTPAKSSEAKDESTVAITEDISKDCAPPLLRNPSPLMAIKIEKGQMMASSSSTRSTASDGIGLSNQVPRQASGKIKTPVFEVDEPTKQKAKAKVTRAQKASTIDIAQ